METRVGFAHLMPCETSVSAPDRRRCNRWRRCWCRPERFGPGIASDLRVHADSLRIKRQHMAEEAAAKTTVKLAFPVVLFIFPVLILVLGGPAFITFAAAFTGK